MIHHMEELFADGADDAADADDGRVEDHAHHHDDHHLDLGDVVGGAGDQRGGGEFVEFGAGEALHLLEDIPAQVARQAGGRAGGEEADRDGAGDREQGQQQHQEAGVQDVVGLELAGIHAQGGVLGLDRRRRPSGRSCCRPGWRISGRSQPVILARVAGGSLLQQGENIRARRELGQVEAEALAHGCGLGRVGQRLFDARDDQQGLAHDRVQLG